MMIEPLKPYNDKNNGMKRMTPEDGAYKVTSEWGTHLIAGGYAKQVEEQPPAETETRRTRRSEDTE